MYQQKYTFPQRIVVGSNPRVIQNPNEIFPRPIKFDHCIVEFTLKTEIEKIEKPTNIRSSDHSKGLEHSKGFGT